jgi:hypothetical protein
VRLSSGRSGNIPVWTNPRVPIVGNFTGRPRNSRQRARYSPGTGGSCVVAVGRVIIVGAGPAGPVLRSNIGTTDVPLGELENAANWGAGRADPRCRRDVRRVSLSTGYERHNLRPTASCVTLLCLSAPKTRNQVRHREATAPRSHPDTAKPPGHRFGRRSSIRDCKSTSYLNDLRASCGRRRSQLASSA